MNEKPTAGDLCWSELATTNVEAAKDFYGKVFGWKFTEHDMGDMQYTIIKINNKECAGIWAIPTDKAKEIPPHWMSYILVADADEALERARKHGATIIKPVSNAGEIGRFAVIKDPVGAHIALWQSLSM